MSQYNTLLDQARKRQKRLYLIAAIGVLTILLLIVVLVVVSRGTRVEITPGEAKLQADIRVIKGLGFCLADTVYSLTGDPVITASAPGFKVATKTIDPVHLGKVFPLELFALPGRLIIEVVGDEGLLPKTAWLINGSDVSLSQKLDVELGAGAYTIAIDNPFYQVKELAVEIARGKETRLQVDLQPVSGALNLSSKPPGALVFLGEEEVGRTPVTLDKIGGRYNIRVALENYIDTVEQVAITRNSPDVRRNYQLELQKAQVVLNLEPKGGVLLVNGIQAVEPLVLDATVEYRLTYMKAGYYSETQAVRLAAGEKRQMSFQLKAELGKVEISSAPPASISVDNRDLGVSPVSADLSAVSHTITFKKKGYRSVSKTIKPQGGRVQKVYVNLLTEYQARLQEAPREYTNKAGIKLKLFLVKDGFTMGAARSEKGQRANEFERQIRLTKPFYASLTEITNSQFAHFDPARAKGTANTPVTSISWQEAVAFCNWLSTKEKLKPFYQTANGQVSGFDGHSDGYRLLSEGEWEWLARKSGKTKRTLFTWGNETIIPPKATNVADESAKGQARFYVPNYNDGFNGVAPVSSFMKESSGLYDMAGNVSEWVNDVYSIVPPQGGYNGEQSTGAAAWPGPCGKRCQLSFRYSNQPAPCFS